MPSTPDTLLETAQPAAHILRVTLRLRPWPSGLVRRRAGHELLAPAPARQARLGETVRCGLGDRLDRAPALVGGERPRRLGVRTGGGFCLGRLGCRFRA